MRKSCGDLLSPLELDRGLVTSLPLSPVTPPIPDRALVMHREPGWILGMREGKGRRGGKGKVRVPVQDPQVKESRLRDRHRPATVLGGQFAR